MIGAVEARVAAAIRAELTDQRAALKLIASEKLRLPVRFYGGCANVDTLETIAAEHARTVFGAAVFQHRHFVSASHPDGSNRDAASA